MRRSGSQRAYTGTLHLKRRQGCGDNFISVGKSDLARRHLAHFVGQPVIDFIADDQEAEQRTFRLGTEVHGLHERLEKMMIAIPPVTGILLVQGPLEVALRGLTREAG